MPELKRLFSIDVFPKSSFYFVPVTISLLPARRQMSVHAWAREQRTGWETRKQRVCDANILACTPCISLQTWMAWEFFTVSRVWLWLWMSGIGTQYVTFIKSPGSRARGRAYLRTKICLDSQRAGESAPHSSAADTQLLTKLMRSNNKCRIASYFRGVFLHVWAGNLTPAQGRKLLDKSIIYHI